MMHISQYKKRKYIFSIAIALNFMDDGYCVDITNLSEIINEQKGWIYNT